MKREFLIPNESIFSNSKLGQKEEVLSLTKIAVSESTYKRVGPAEGVKAGVNLKSYFQLVEETTRPAELSLTFGARKWARSWEHHF